MIDHTVYIHNPLCSSYHIAGSQVSYTSYTFSSLCLVLGKPHDPKSRDWGFPTGEVHGNICLTVPFPSSRNRNNMNKTTNIHTQHQPMSNLPSLPRISPKESSRSRSSSPKSPKSRKESQEWHQLSDRRGFLFFFSGKTTLVFHICVGFVEFLSHL